MRATIDEMEGQVVPNIQKQDDPDPAMDATSEEEAPELERARSNERLIERRRRRLRVD